MVGAGVSSCHLFGICVGFFVGEKSTCPGTHCILRSTMLCILVVSGLPKHLALWSLAEFWILSCFPCRFLVVE